MLKEVAVLRRYGSDILKGLDKQIAQVLCRMFRPNAMPSGEEILLIADRFETFRMNQGHLGTPFWHAAFAKFLLWSQTQYHRPGPGSVAGPRIPPALNPDETIGERFCRCFDEFVDRELRGQYVDVDLKYKVVPIDDEDYEDEEYDENVGHELANWTAHTYTLSDYTKAQCPKMTNFDAYLGQIWAENG